MEGWRANAAQPLVSAPGQHSLHGAYSRPRAGHLGETGIDNNKAYHLFNLSAIVKDLVIIKLTSNVAYVVAGLTVFFFFIPVSFKMCYKILLYH